MTRRRSLLIAALVLAPACYALGYYVARVNHRLVRYESGCIARPSLHWDFWGWSYACADLRRYVSSNDMLGSDALEGLYSPLIAGEELARGTTRRPRRPTTPLDRRRCHRRSQPPSTPPCAPPSQSRQSRPVPPSKSPELGDVILDKYELTRIIGEGGMGTVFAARHRGFDQLVALKFLKPTLLDNLEVVERFTREARAARRIQSDHVARVDDVDSAGGVPFIVMEYLTGSDLARILADRGQLPITESADLLMQACEAIAEAHTLGIVHRDLKPANLFVTRARDGLPFVKVLDFGISKSTGASDPSVTANEAFLGSPGYMSPEQITSAGDVDLRSDVWSLGVILYEMLTGARPFTGETSLAISSAITRGKYPRPSDTRPAISRELEGLIADTLKVEPDERIRTVQDFAKRLARFGTDAATFSLGRITRLASGANGEPEPPPPAAPKPPPKDAAETPTDAGVGTTTGAAPLAETMPGRSAWRRVVVIGALAAAAGIAALAPRLRPATRASSEPATPVASAAPSESAAATAQAPATPPASAAAAPDPDPAAAVAAAPSVEPPRLDETRPAPGAGNASSGNASSGKTSPAGASPASASPSPPHAAAAKTAPAAPCTSTSDCTTACDGGSAAACNDLGVDYATGDGVARDPAKAIALYRRACKGGLPRACANLGWMHFNGEGGVDKDPVLAASFFQRACDGGAAMGCLGVSRAYAEGLGADRNPEQAFLYAEHACNGGAVAGCIREERARIEGTGVTKDVQGGLAHLDALCTRREPTVCSELAKIFTQGDGDVHKDPLRAQDYAKKACDLGSKVDCGLSHLSAARDSVMSSHSQFNAGFQAACDGGSATACGMLGKNLIAGIGVSAPDPVRGMALLRKACAGGYADACKEVGDSGAP
jgi:serine/threonine protein kinase/TPR repeat protein